MAARKTSGGRKALHRRRNRFFFRGRWWKIVFFRGYELRHMLPDLDIMLWHGDGTNDFVPPGQLWIDRRYRGELAFLLEVFQIEKMKKWSKKGDNDRYPPYKALRDYLKEKLCKAGPVPEFVERKEWSAEHQLSIWYVRGEIVRRHFDPHFIFGGHDQVYGSYIKEPRTIWVDVCQDPREIRYTLLHEALERTLMEKGWRYGPAHARAIKAELKLRGHEYVCQDKDDGFLPPKPLKVIPIDQSETGCGPTACKMLLDYDGIAKPDGASYAEEDLIALCGCDPYFGTDHAPLARGMTVIAGGRVAHGEGGTVEDLRRIVRQERRPVLVGWWNGPHRTSEEVRADPDLDEGHYAVVIHVSRTHVWLADSAVPDTDPEVPDPDGTKPGLLKLPIRAFQERWYDMDGNPSGTDPGYHVVRGWHLYLRAGTGDGTDS